MRFRLSKEDQQRLGAPEWLDVDLEHYPVELAEAVESAGGDWTSFIESGPAGWRTRVWVGLRNAGVEVDLKTLTFDLNGIRKDLSESGKEPSPSGDESTSSPSSSTSD